MKTSNLFDSLRQSSVVTKLLVGLVVLIWLVVGILVVGGVTLFTEERSQAQQAPTITLNPTSAAVGNGIVVEGRGWQPGHTVVIYLDKAPSDAVASVVVDSQGRFTTSFLVPADPRWQSGATVPVLAHTEDTGLSATASLNINSSLPASTPTPVETPLTPTATAQPNK